MHENKDHLFNLQTSKPAFMYQLGHGLLMYNGDKDNLNACEKLQNNEEYDLKLCVNMSEGHLDLHVNG